ncbi:hypothetical protein MJM83_33250, partial [Salmonella enterica subsp. enterica serovar Montevideo]|nr:hypothetical protein [Salmonella enterica subsp. enterica serovar Montevideo]
FDFSDSLDDNGEFSYRLTGLARSTNEQQKSSESQRYAIAPSFKDFTQRVGNKSINTKIKPLHRVAQRGGGNRFAKFTIINDGHI